MSVCLYTNHTLTLLNEYPWWRVNITDLSQKCSSQQHMKCKDCMGGFSYTHTHTHTQLRNTTLFLFAPTSSLSQTYILYFARPCPRARDQLVLSSCNTRHGINNLINPRSRSASGQVARHSTTQHDTAHYNVTVCPRTLIKHIRLSYQHYTRFLYPIPIPDPWDTREANCPS